MKKKILIAGSPAFMDIYEKPLAYGFQKNNCIVNIFKIYKKPTYKKNTPKIYKFYEYILLTRLRVSFFLKKINNSLVKKVKKFSPDIILLWRSTTILPKTVKKIKEISPKTKIILYHNDNPYIGLINKFKYRHFLNSIKYSDITAGYRPEDIKNIKKYGAKKIKLIMPNYISYLHKPISAKKKIDVIFIGHYSEDRAQILNLLNEKKIKFEVYGPGWENVKSKVLWKNKIKLKKIINQKYVNKISQSKIAIGFLSKKNKDVYTRRCFEIPACGTLLLAPETMELKKILKNQKEAIFWKSENEIANIIFNILNNKNKLNKISKKGMLRIKNNNHSEIDRAREILKW